MRSFALHLARLKSARRADFNGLQQTANDCFNQSCSSHQECIGLRSRAALPLVQSCGIRRRFGRCRFSRRRRSKRSDYRTGRLGEHKSQAADNRAAKSRADSSRTALRSATKHEQVGRVRLAAFLVVDDEDMSILVRSRHLAVQLTHRQRQAKSGCGTIRFSASEAQQVVFTN